ncbi:MAG: transposase DNA-binding-containing protein [Pirellulales bacterium]
MLGKVSFTGWAGNGLIALSWERNELATLDFGHKRRNDQAIYIAEHLVKCPDSTPQAFADNAALEATYRFANSEHTAAEVIMSAHRDATLQRIQDGDTVATIQDTTVIDLTKPTLQVSDAGVLKPVFEARSLRHPLYAVRENGIPLGIVDQVSGFAKKSRKTKPASNELRIGESLTSR